MANSAGSRRINGGRQPAATGRQEDLRKSPQALGLDAVVESITDGFLVVDGAWRYTYVNGAAAAFLRSTPEKLSGATIWEALPQSRYPRFCEEITRAAGEKIPIQFEEYFEPPGRWYECRCYPHAGGLAIVLLDATEHKQVEEVLLESRQVMELAIAGSNAGVWRIDLDPNKPGVLPDYVYLSPQLKALLGFEEDEFPNSRSAWQRRIPPADVRRIEQAARDHVEGRSDLFQVDFRIRHKDENLRWFSSRGRLYRDEYNRLIRWVGIDWDITERKRAEEELARAKQEWERTFDAVPDLIAVIDPEHRITRVNRAMAERLGGRCGAIVESMCFACIHGQDAPVASCPHLQALADGREHTAEVYEDRLGGYFLVSCTPLFDPDGRPVGTVHVSRDITEQKRMEADLRRLNDQLGEEVQAQTRELQEAVDRLEHEVARRVTAEGKLRRRSQLLEGFFRHTITPVAFMNWCFDFVRVNEAFAGADGKSPGQFVGENFFALYPDAGLQAVFERVVQSRQPYRAYAKLFNFPRAPQRSDTYWNWWLTPLLDERGEVQFLVLNLEDVTERQKAFAELEHRARQLQRLALDLSQAEDRERKRLADILHDDLQQQLAAMKFHLGLLGGRSRGDPSQRAVVARLDRMLTDAIEKSRSLSHELSPALLYQSDLSETFVWLAEQVQARHGLVVRVGARGPVDLHSDALKAFLYKTGQELLFNVVKHARTDEARIELRRFRRYVGLSVSDEGRGFNPQELRETTGFGLLSIRERVGQLGGRMRIISAKGRGCTLRIVLPDDDAVESASRGCLPSGRQGSLTLRVLVADDHEIVRQGLASLLGEQCDIEVVGEAANGREAVDLAGRLHPDVVIMDATMPLMNGDEATRQIKGQLPDMRIVALSMHGENGLIQRMRAAGAEAYVLKTAPSEELLAAIRGGTAD